MKNACIYLIIPDFSRVEHCFVNVVVNFLSDVVLVFLLFLDMVMYAYEVEIK